MNETEEDVRDVDLVSQGGGFGASTLSQTGGDEMCIVLALSLYRFVATRRRILPFRSFVSVTCEAARISSLSMQ